MQLRLHVHPTALPTVTSTCGLHGTAPTPLLPVPPIQDRVPAFGARKVQAIVQRELGAPPGVLFREFDPRPIAAASLGQVHLARLHSGEQVVVKVSVRT